MADRGGGTCKIRKRHPPQHNRQEKRCVSDDQMHPLFTGAKGQFFTFVGLGFRKCNIRTKSRETKFKTLRGLPKYLCGTIREEESMVAQKIATCCYCGTKAALVLRGKDSH